MSWQIFVEIAPPPDAAAPSYTTISQYVLDQISIEYGRKTFDEDVSPTSASIGLLLDSSLGTFDVDAIDVGHILRISVSIDGELQKRRRFIGNITDLAIDKERMNIAAVSSSMSRYGKYTLDFPITNNTTAGAIAVRIANDADPSTPNYLRFGGAANFWAIGVYQLDADFQPGDNALEALRLAVGSEPFGFIYEDFTTEGMLSNDQNTRKTKTPDFILTGDEILDDWAVSKSITGQVTSAIVNYVGPNTVRVSATTPQGEIERTYDTIIINAADATEYATFMANRGAVATYDLPSITIPIGILPVARQQELIAFSNLDGLRINKYVQIPQIRPYIATNYFVEGWNEQLSRSSWNLTLHLSNVGRSRYFQAWDEVTPTLTWAATPTFETWQLMNYDWI